MTLAGMIAIDEDALICDLAETYGIFDYKNMDLQLLATLSAGLREGSRIKKKINGITVEPNMILLASIVDRLGSLVWLNSEDGRKGINRPKEIVKQIIGTQETVSKDAVSFSSGKEFEEERKKFLRQVK